MTFSPFKVSCALMLWILPTSGFATEVADTLAQRAMLENLTMLLRESKPTSEQINQWSALALALGEKALWQSLCEDVAGNVDSPALLSEEAWLLFSSQLDTNKIGGLDPLAADLGIPTLKWQLATYAHAQSELTAERKKLKDLVAPDIEELVKPPANPPSVPVIPFALSAVVMVGISVFKIIRSKRGHLAHQINTDDPVIKDIDDRIRNEASHLYELAISQLEFKLTEETFKNSLNKSLIWNELSNRQKLLLYLLLQGYSAEDCAEFLQISKGSIYNQRSELRRLFKLNNDEPFASILK